jgi:hypothetical protein
MQNKRPGFLEKHGLDAEMFCEQKPGLITLLSFSNP